MILSLKLILFYSVIINIMINTMFKYTLASSYVKCNNRLTSLFSKNSRVIHCSSINIKKIQTKRLFMTDKRDFSRYNDIEIPIDRVQFSFARSSGPGGQNVNKLNTKAELRFHVLSADWIEEDTKHRLIEYQTNKINKDGDLIISSQEHRTQGKNKEDCINKLKYMIAEAKIEPKDRHMWEGLSEKTKIERKDEKRKRGEIKSFRIKNSKDFFD